MSLDRAPFQNQPEFTVYYSERWMNTLLAAFPHMRDASQLVALPDGRKALFCALETDHFAMWSWLDALPFALFGSPIVNEGTLTAADMRFVLEQFAQGAAWLSVNLDPVHPLANAAALGHFASPLTTHILRMEGDFEAVQRAFTKTARYDARMAEKKGVTARRGHSTADFAAYYQLVQQAVTRWGLTTPPFPEALYQAFATLPESDISLWLAEFEGQVIGGQLNIHYAPGRTLYWGSGIHPDYMHLNPTKLLQREAIREACERGVTVYNMGPSAGFDGKPLDGVRQAKEAFGARPHDYAVALYMNLWALRFRGVRNRLRRVVKRGG